MPPSAKRSQRVKRENPQMNNEGEMEVTSPAQSAKRRKTKSDSRDDEAPSEPAQLPKTADELDLSSDEIITAVSRHLLLPHYEVQVATDHSNHHHSRLNTNVSAYAKVAGRDWTFYIKRLRTNIGRPPEGYVPDMPRNEPYTAAMSNEGVGEQLPAENTEPSRIHIDVGPNKLVSRLHAEIFFDSNTSRWMIMVNGRNGIKINDLNVRKGQEFELYSGCVFEVAGVEMMFILPESETQPLRIADRYLQRAGLIQGEPLQENMPPSANFLAAANKAKALGQLGRNGQPLLAPAPPDYRRPDTPAKQRVRGPTVPASSPAFAGGIGGNSAVFHAEAIDYQDEAVRHIKPAFTYGQLISQAIMQADNEQATLNEIYEYMKRHYSHYRRPEFFKGWQNSIRHNLSLNPGFKVRQRGPEDTGKGGYWCFVPEMRDQMVADAWGPKSARKSPPKRRSGSATTPGNSPRGAKRGASHNPGEADGGSPSRKVKKSSRSPAAAPRGALKQEDRTPERLQLPKPRTSTTDPSEQRDGSPTPRNRGDGARRGSQVFGLSDAAVGSPVLSSSFDPAGDGNANALMTPAPVKRHPHLAPPSTAQRPSQHMPTSSPAPFWRFADTISGTPSLSVGKLLGADRDLNAGAGGSRYDMSPLRGMGGGGGLSGMDGLQSSSPAPQRRRSRPVSKDGVQEDAEMGMGIGMGELKEEDSEGEEPTFDLTRGFMKISNYHQSTAKAAPAASAPAAAPATAQTAVSTPSKGQA